MLKCFILGTVLSFARSNYVAFTLRYTADPAPLVVNGTVFLYTSHDLDNATFYNMYDYSLVSTKDMVNFEDHGLVFDARNAKWGPGGAWAQQVVGPVTMMNGQEAYVMYWPNIYVHAANCTDGCGVGIAVSYTGPTGPFQDITPDSVAFVAGDDPTVFRETESSSTSPYGPNATFVCSNPNGGYPICGQVSANMTSWTAPPRPISGTPHFFEAPWLMRLQGPGGATGEPTGEGVYMMSYMCPARNEVTKLPGHYGQDICMAVCNPLNSSVPCPLGNYSYLSTQLQWNPPGDCGTPFGCSQTGGSNAHHGLFRVGEQWYLAYHTRVLSARRGLANAGYQRNVGVDAAYLDPVASAEETEALGWTAAGLNMTAPVFWPVTATPSWLRQLSWIDPYSSPVRGALMAEASLGVSTVAPPAGMDAPGSARPVLFPNGQSSWTRLSGVDFGQASGANITLSLTAMVSAQGNVSSLAFLLDSLNGPVLAVCAGIKPTTAPGAPAVFVSVRCTVPPPGRVYGVHDLHIVADTALPTWSPSDPPAGLQLLQWQLSGGHASGSVPAPVRVLCAGVLSKATLAFVSLGATSNAPVTATGPVPGSGNTTVVLVDNQDGTYALGFGAGSSGGPFSYLCSPLPATGSEGPALPLTAAATAPTDACARFSLQGTTEGSYALLTAGTASVSSRAFVAVDGTTGAVTASVQDPRDAPADGARFWLHGCGNPLRG